MSETYTIQIFNNSKADREYLFFQSVPVPSGTPTLYTIVHQSSGIIHPGDESNVIFQINQEFFAVFGTSRQGLEVGATISAGASLPVVLQDEKHKGTLCRMTTSPPRIAPSPEWADQGTQTITDQPGCYGIKCDDSFDFPNQKNFFIGLGAKNPSSGSGIPIATIEAQPSRTYYFRPIVKYYIATATHDPGTIVDITSLSDVLTVDFTSGPLTATHQAVYTHEANGKFTEGSPK